MSKKFNTVEKAKSFVIGVPVLSIGMCLAGEYADHGCIKLQPAG